MNAAGFAEFLPPPLSGWQRGSPVTGPADMQLFGGGISTRAVYLNDSQLCELKITMTGNAPMMQGLSMNFSNPAAAGLTGARVAYVGDEPIVITPDGEVQTLTNNYLTQFSGNCPHEYKLAYVAITDFDRLRAYRLASAALPGGAGNESTEGLEWEGVFGGPAKDWAYAMTGTHDGGLCTAGRTASKGAGLEDVWLVRVDGRGRLLWDKSFGGPAIDRARAIIETQDRGLVVAGATESKGAGEFDVWVLKTDADGNLLWDRVFGGPATDWASAAVETSDGGIALGAYTQDKSGAPYDFWIIKLDKDGELLWQRRYGGPATDWINAMTETADGGLVAVGHTESKGAGAADLWVLKVGSTGDPQWDRTVGGTESDYASTVTATRDGGVVVGGMTLSEGAGGFDIRVLKLDSSGETAWDRIFGGAKDDWVRAVVETHDGGYALSGYTISQGAGLYDVWILKLDPDGALLWERTHGESGNEWARALIELPDGGLAVAGDTYSKGAGASDVLVFKIAPE
ncbi:MAG: hypothetical protein QF803_09325 [Gammaproteobacteria bacterium]|nr:hypothetical protein [Gammaproteobacteria bacterium]MDP6695803.1 hypothetical protein [Gammaproteobacteria bacterium]